LARIHGSQVRLYLDGRDISGDIISVAPKFGAATHDATTFASGGWSESDAGLLEWSADLEGFYDPAEGGIVEQLDDLIGSGGVLSIYDGEADSIGDTGVLLSEAILENMSEPKAVADLMKLSGTLKGNGRPGPVGKLLHPKSEETNTGVEASLDNAASSADGGRATLHVLAITGTWTVAVEESSNNGSGDAFAAKASFTGITAPGAYTMEVTGTVERYLRASHTEDVAGSITYVLGFARY
jgi:hypothetical protein